MKNIQLLSTAIRILCILAISLQIGTAQNEKIKATNSLEFADNYSTEVNTLSYIIIPLDEFEIKEGLKEIKALAEQKRLNKVRVNKFRIEDIKLGSLSYVIVRRFETQDEANSFIEFINQNTQICTGKSLHISQGNYRKFLKKKDIEEYRLFIAP